MVKLRVNKTFEIPQKDFDKYCKKHRVGIKTAKIGIRNMLEERVWAYVRNLEGLSDVINKQMHLEESAWAMRNAPARKLTESETREVQYKLFNTRRMRDE